MWGKKQGSGGRFHAKVALKSMGAARAKITLENKGCTTLVKELAQCGRLLVPRRRRVPQMGPVSRALV